MTAWVALLRGVNVNGITVRSADLAALFRGLGFERVSTVLASGNVRFDTDAGTTDRPSLRSRIEAALGERFGYDAWIVLVTRDELERAIAGFPFDAEDAERHPYVVFFSSDAVRDDVVDAAASFDRKTDPIATGEGVLYWCVEKGHSVDTPFAKLLAKARYKATTTTRNLRTLVKIAG